MQPNRRAIVTLLTPSDIEELFSIRAVLEGLAARIAATNASDDDIEELRMLNARLQRARPDGHSWLLRHHELHDFLCEIGSQHRLLQEIRRIRTTVDPYLLLHISVYRDTEMTGTEHAQLVDAIASRNGALAEEFVANHVMSAGRGVIQFIKARQEGTLGDRKSRDGPRVKSRGGRATKASILAKSESQDTKALVR